MGTFVGIVGKTEVPKEHLETYVKQMLTVWKYGGNDAVYPYVDPDKIATMFLFATSPLLSQSGNTKSSIKGNTLKEPLNKTPTADDGSFPPILRFEKWEICRSRWRQRSHTDAGMPFAGTQSIPPFSKPCLDEKSLTVHSR